MSISTKDLDKLYNSFISSFVIFKNNRKRIITNIELSETPQIVIERKLGETMNDLYQKYTSNSDTEILFEIQNYLKQNFDIMKENIFSSAVTRLDQLYDNFSKASFNEKMKEFQENKSISAMSIDNQKDLNRFHEKILPSLNGDEQSQSILRETCFKSFDLINRLDINPSQFIQFLINAGSVLPEEGNDNENKNRYTRGEIDAMEDKEKVILAANILNETCFFDEDKINYTSEVLFVRAMVGNLKAEYGENLQLKQLITPHMSERRAKQIKAVVVIDGYINTKNKQYYKTFKITGPFVLSKSERRIIFKKAKEIQVDSIKDIAESIGKEMNHANPIFTRVDF